MLLRDSKPSQGRRPGSLVDTREGRDPRIVLFHGIIGALLATLACGLAYQQLFKSTSLYEEARVQNERRIIVPGPRGNIYDRNGKLLVGNRPRLAVVLYLDELRNEIRAEAIRIRRNYRETGDRDLPTSSQMEQIARVSVVQGYLDQVDALLGRDDRVDSRRLEEHFARQLLLPYTLIDDLPPEQFSRLIEHLPVNSPLQVYTSNTREYPQGAAAAHVLGYVGINENSDAEELPGQGLKTFSIKETIGRDGLEKRFDSTLQGQAGYTILRVDPGGYKVNPPIEHRTPVQGRNLTTSLDIDLQKVAEAQLGDQTGAAVALDVNTGEILVLASEPSYDLNVFSPRLSIAARDDIEKRKAWNDRAVNGLSPPGSTFKILVSIAALKHGAITPESKPADCEGVMMIGKRRATCDNGNGHHGELMLPEAIADSCDIYFYTVGIAVGPQAIADEARRFHLDQPTGVELPLETHKMIIPDPAWLKKRRDETWTAGHTANMAIGQGDVYVTPLDMACFVASVARGETVTRPTLLHDPNRPPQHSEPIGLTPEQYAAIVDGMERCTQSGGTLPGEHHTAYILSTLDALKVPGVRIAGKTGTAQLPGKLDMAWFICFAPVEKPEIAIAVAIEGDTPGDFSGGLHSAPVASGILRAYFAKKHGDSVPGIPAGPAQPVAGY